ncbi:hypothetical protein HN011_008521 [Eciton burchellii]|nr:hypothetical protein HN011_008521 [Eciton burchellii]
MEGGITTKDEKNHVKYRANGPAEQVQSGSGLKGHGRSWKYRSTFELIRTPRITVVVPASAAAAAAAVTIVIASIVRALVVVAVMVVVVEQR